MFDEKLIPIDSYEIDPHPNYTLFKLHTKQGTVPLYTSSEVNEKLRKDFRRPVTHDIILGVVEGFDLKIIKCIIDHVEDSIYYAKLFIDRNGKEIVSIDIRPSDVLILMKQHKFPVYVAQKVIDLTKD
ncbi:MAG: bifunctional nuclease family protein [Verrucomicrobia bacterium]|nr:bifunctional nuclease family protein [Verrucomicrobiota bacterium]NDE62912.1 bifunctional nuclease family protein [Chlamydiota bacterium]